jgi:hypothetical protein
METHELNQVVNFFEMLDDGFKVETSGLRGLLSISPELRESYQNAQMKDTDWLKIEAERRSLRLQIIAKNLSDSKSETTGKAARKNTNLADYFFKKYSSKKDQMLEEIRNSATGRELLKTARERTAQGLTQNDDLREYFQSQLHNYQLKHESVAKEFCNLLNEPEIAGQLVKMFYGDSLQFKTPQKITGKYLEIAENIAQNLAQDENLIASFEHSGSQSTRITSDKLVGAEALKYIKSDFDFFKLYSDDKEFKQDFLETVFVMAEEIMGNRQTLEQVIDQYDLDAEKTKEMVKLSFTEQNGERFQKEVQNLLKKQPSILLRKNALGRVWSSLKPFLYNQGEAVETTTNSKTKQAVRSSNPKGMLTEKADILRAILELNDTYEKTIQRYKKGLAEAKNKWNREFNQFALDDEASKFNQRLSRYADDYRAVSNSEEDTNEILSKALATRKTQTPNNLTLQALEAKFGQKLALELVEVVLDTRKDDWRNNKYKQKNVRTGLSEFVQKSNLSDTVEAEAYDIIFKHNDY